MNKAELIEQLAQKTHLSKAQSEELLNSVIEIIQKSICSGEEVKLVGFGTFDQTLRKQRNARNPKTGSLMTIPESCVPRFRPGKEFKEKLANSWRHTKSKPC
ncbi:MAG: HU family DNA-binding protein [Bdellovibrionales bacterium]|nr:HU family DNA-binding protein [Bdellovibrionales bacterium]